MKKNELKNALVAEGIRSMYYSLEGGLPDNALCLSYEKNIWIIYYSERGQRFDIEEFESEEAACEEFFIQAVRDFKKYS
jgi:hypothetical protein